MRLHGNGGVLVWNEEELGAAPLPTVILTREEVGIAFGSQFTPLSSREKEKMSPKFPVCSAILVYDSHCGFVVVIVILPRRNCRKSYTYAGRDLWTG